LTPCGRGSESYRGPEMVKEGPIICKQSDIFALGCVFYELASGRKAFERDYNVFEYMLTKRRPKNLSLEGLNDPSCKFYLSQIIYAMLGLNWWERPSADDILGVVVALTKHCNWLNQPEQNIDGNALDDLSTVNTGRVITLPTRKLPDTEYGKKLRWRPYWYVILLKYG